MCSMWQSTQAWWTTGSNCDKMDPKLNPVLSNTHQIISFYLFESTVLLALRASICQFLLTKRKGVNGNLKSTKKHQMSYVENVGFLQCRCRVIYFLLALMSHSNALCPKFGPPMWKYFSSKWAFMKFMKNHFNKKAHVVAAIWYFQKLRRFEDD